MKVCVLLDWEKNHIVGVYEDLKDALHEMTTCGNIGKLAIITRDLIKNPKELSDG